jgi:hypothetical protein
MTRFEDWIKMVMVALAAGWIAYTPRPVPSATAQPPRALEEQKTERITRAADIIGQYQASMEGAPSKVALEFLVALLPDPIDSESKWMFDPLLDAISSAAAQRGYSLFKLAFPDWPRQDPGRPPSPPSSRAHEEEPGVVAFHSESDGTPKLLVVLTAYETPTGGPHATALDTALDTAYQYGDCAKIRILGPTFSGSSPMLRSAIERLRRRFLPGCKPRFHVWTGSATALSNRRVLTAGDRESELAFNSTVLSDEEMLPAMITFVKGRFTPTPAPMPKPVLAVLIESTAYGAAARKTLQAKEYEDVKIFRFPTHISRLRSGSPSAVANSADGRRLPLVIGDRFEPTDRVPLAATDTTGPAVELTLDNTFDQLRRQRVDAIGIMATDTRDKLFLVQQIAKAIPGVLLFTTENDVLYAHPQYRSAIRGMIVGSSYPPVPLGTMGDRTSYLFPSSMAVGTFNAASALLSDQNTWIDSRRPAVWISVVSNGALWPIHKAAGADKCQSGEPEHGCYITYQQGTSVKEQTKAPQASVWTWVTTVVMLVLALSPWLVRILSRRAKGPRLTFEEPNAPPTLVFRYRVVYLTAFAIAAIMFAAVWFLQSPPVATALLLAGPAAFIAGRSRNQAPLKRTPGRIGRRHVLVPVLCAAAVLMALGLGWYWISHYQGDSADIFFDRATHPRSGASPLFALLLVLSPTFIWGLMQLAASEQIPSRRLLRLTAALGHGVEHNRDWLARMHAVLWRPFEGATRLEPIVIILSVLVTAFVFLTKRLVSIEHWSFTLIFVAAWLVSQFLITLSLARALRMWRLLRQLLKGLAAHPLSKRAYASLDDDMLGDRLSPRRPAMMTLGPLVDARLALNIDATELKTSVNHQALGRTLSAFQPVSVGEFEAELQMPGKGWSDGKTFHKCVDDAHQIVLLLREHWWGRPLPIEDRVFSRWCGKAEKFLAMFVLLFFREFLSRLVDILMFVVAAVILLVVAQGTFTFHPRQILLGATWIYAVFAVGSAMYVFVTIERNRVLSLLSGTPDGAIQWDSNFLGKMIMYALIPLATLFAAQFPQFGDVIAKWVGPATGALPF